MPRATLILFALVALLGVGLAWVATRPTTATLSEAEVRAIVDAQVSERLQAAEPAVAALDPEALNPMIEDYLLGNPRILQQVSEALDQEIRTARLEETRTALASLQSVIYEDPDHVVLGNPEGDVTLVELFDYNCGYCRQALPDLVTLLAEDPNLKVILKEFPILSQDSAEAARVSVLVAKSDADYLAFHQQLFSSRGQVTGETALSAAREVGLNPISLQLEMSTPEVTAVLNRSYEIAQALKISGTPTYILGDEVIPGAVGIDALRARIANMRECGQTFCAGDATGG